MPDVNLLAVLVCGIASVVVGGIWYGPIFGKIWMEELGMNKLDPAKQKEMMQRMPMNYFKQFIMALITAYIFANILWAYSVAMPEQSAIMAGLQGAFWMWLGFIATVKYGESLWTGKSKKYVLIDLGYWLILLGIWGLILTHWK